MKSKPITTIYGDVVDRVTRVKWSKVNLYPSAATRTKIVKYTLTCCATIFLLNMFVFYDVEKLECLETAEKVRSGELSVDFGITRNIVKDKDENVPYPIRPVLNCLDQEDNLLIRTIRENYFEKGNGNPYRFTKDYYQILHPLQTEDILDLVFYERDLYNGFFIEAGAFDSETMSVSLYFEKGLSENKVGEGVDVQCLPLYSLIQAAGNPTVNLLILDIEGAELAVLKTLPWEKVDIEIMTVETDLVGETGISGGSQKEIRDFIISKGYKFFHHRHNKNYMTGKENNDLFIREDIVRKYKVDKYHSKNKP